MPSPDAQIISEPQPKMRSVAFLLLVGLAVCTAYVTVEGPKPNTPSGHCISQKVGKMTVGQKIAVPNKCERAECLANGQVSYSGCGAVQIPPNCKFDKVDKSKPYPNCCESKFTC